MASKSKSEPAPEKTPKAETPKADAQPSLEKRVSYLERKLEQVFGIDLNKDGKIGFANWRLVFALLLISAGIAAAVNIIHYPTPSGGTAFSVDTDGDMTVGGVMVKQAQSITVAASSTTITPTASLILVTTSSAVTNTLLANPSAAGQELTIINLSTNNLVFADAANVEVSTGPVTNGQYDTVSFIAQSTSSWVETGRSNN